MPSASREGDLPHQPVLYQEIIEALNPASPKKYVDLTLGAGGHAWGILDGSRPDGSLLGFDRDPQAVKLAEERLSEFDGRFSIVQDSYTALSQQLHERSWESVDGIVLDLGASSMQFDNAERGFSFLKDGPLDMRFDPQAFPSAEDIVNRWDEKSLADAIFQYGEERRSRQIASAILKARPIQGTLQLAEVVAKAARGKRRSRLHPATRTFQAIRIAVNQELESLEETLPQAVEALGAGGRLAVISFHSLEDRIVKHYFRDLSRPKGEPDPFTTIEPSAPLLRLLNRKPITPTEQEVMRNPRARSAKLRIAEKL